MNINYSRLAFTVIDIFTRLICPFILILYSVCCSSVLKKFYMDSL